MTEAHERKVKRRAEYESEVHSPREKNATVTARYLYVNKVLGESVPYTAIFLNDQLPSDPIRRRRGLIIKWFGFHTLALVSFYTLSGGSMWMTTKQRIKKEGRD